MDKYYFSDALFELELNLHNIRKELIAMIEEFEQTDCSECLQLKCKCVTEEITSGGGQNHVSDKSWKKDCNDLKLAPSPDSLPKPNFDKMEGNCNENEESPAPSTPEKEYVNNDIEAWIEASRKVEQEVMKILSAINPKNSLVTIESVRPADKPIKTPQKSNAFNNTVFATNATPVDSFFKYFKSPVTDKRTDTKVVYMSNNLASAYNRHIKQSYSYF